MQVELQSDRHRHAPLIKVAPEGQTEQDVNEELTQLFKQEKWQFIFLLNITIIPYQNKQPNFI